MIILLYGPDVYRAKLKLEEIKEQFLKKFPESRSNIEIVDFENADWEESKTKLRCGPLFAQKRLIIIKNFFSKKSKANIPDKEFAEWFKSTGNEASTFIFLDENVPQKYLRVFDSLGAFKQNFDYLTGDNAKKWIKERVSHWGGNISEDACDILTSWAGDDFCALEQEIIKLVNYSPTNITAEDVKALLSVNIEAGVFSWLDTIREKKAEQALHKGFDLMESGASIPYISTMLSNEFRDLLLLLELKSASLTEIKEKLSMHPFRLRKLSATSRNFTKVEIRKVLDGIVVMDRRSKRLNVSGAVLLCDFLLNSCLGGEHSFSGLSE